jgi:hypothetical protein
MRLSPILLAFAIVSPALADDPPTTMQLFTQYCVRFDGDPDAIAKALTADGYHESRMSADAPAQFKNVRSFSKSTPGALRAFSLDTHPVADPAIHGDRRETSCIVNANPPAEGTERDFLAWAGKWQVTRGGSSIIATSPVDQAGDRRSAQLSRVQSTEAISFLVTPVRPRR